MCMIRPCTCPCACDLYAGYGFMTQEAAMEWAEYHNAGEGPREWCEPCRHGIHAEDPRRAEEDERSERQPVRFDPLQPF
jgi:hypothetical protein